MKISILIKAEGQPPQEITDLQAFALVTIPEKSPDRDTNFIGANLDSRAIAEIGAYMIRVAKHQLTGGELKPLGQKLSKAESRIIKPRGVH